MCNLTIVSIKVMHNDIVTMLSSFKKTAYHVFISKNSVHIKKELSSQKHLLPNCDVRA